MTGKLKLVQENIKDVPLSKEILEYFCIICSKSHDWFSLSHSLQ